MNFRLSKVHVTRLLTTHSFVEVPPGADVVEVSPETDVVETLSEGDEGEAFCSSILFW